MVRPEGLEPSTLALEGRCSIQLSYGRINPDLPVLSPHGEFGRGREIRTPDILLPKQARYQTALYPGQRSLQLNHKALDNTATSSLPTARKGRILLTRLDTVKQEIDVFFKQSKGLAVSIGKAPRTVITKLKHRIKTVNYYKVITSWNGYSFQTCIWTSTGKT